MSALSSVKRKDKGAGAQFTTYLDHRYKYSGCRGYMMMLEKKYVEYTNVFPANSNSLCSLSIFSLSFGAVSFDYRLM